MNSLTEIREAFSRDRFSTNQAGIRIVSVQPDTAVCEMPITPEHLNARGINYLLNVGPDYLGRFPAPAIDILREVGRKSR